MTTVVADTGDLGAVAHLKSVDRTTPLDTRRTGHTTDLSPQQNLRQCKRSFFLTLHPPKLSRSNTEQMTEMTC
jgi:hypothetical protein